MDNAYLFEMLNDEPGNIKRINSTLYDIKNTLYANLYKAQQALCGFYQTRIKFSSYRPLRHNRIAFDVNYTYIEGKRRCEFKRSQYYKREVFCDEIFKHPEIFNKGVMVFVDGKLTNNFYVYFKDNSLEIRFARYTKHQGTPADGMMHTAIDQYEIDDVTVSVVIMPICKKVIGAATQNTLIGDNYIVSEYADYLLSLSYTDVGRTPMLFINIATADTNISGALYDCMSYTKNNTDLILSDVTFESPHGSSVMSVVMFYPDGILVDKVVPSDGWFSLPLQRTPIPKENILVFRKGSGSNMVLDDRATITMYYPNIYHIESTHDGEFYIYAFYNNDTGTIGLTHANELNIYTSYMDGVIEYSDNTIPEYIKTYKPVAMEYNIGDYNESSLEPLEYKINKLREVIKENPALYSYYLEKYVEMYPNVFTVVDEEDYASRLRTDTSQELPDKPVYTFAEERYMFSMKRENNAQIFRFFIDNKAYHVYMPNTVFYDNDYAYIYIPAEYIHVGSHIEVQKLHDNTMVKAYVVDSSVPTHIVIDDMYRTAAEDLYMTHRAGAIEEYVTTGFTICEKIPVSRRTYNTDLIIGGEVYRPVDKLSFVRYRDLYIVWDNDDLDGETILIRTDKYNIQLGGFDGLVQKELRAPINTDKRNFLSFRDGRLMAPFAIKIRYADNSNGPHVIQSLIAQDADTEVVVQHMPDKYNLECDYTDSYVKRLRIYQKYLDVNDVIEGRQDNIYDNQINSSDELMERIEASGHFVDLTNMISKPLDFRWYEIYMNGLKLTENDVKFIGPYQMVITLQDDYPDIDSFIIIDLLGFIQKYVLPLPFINPDWVQVTDEMIEEYPEVMDRRNNVVFDSDVIHSMESSILLNPDIAEGYTLSDIHVEGGG